MYLPAIGVYPYDFATSVQQLKSAPSLPPIEKFFSKISNANISMENYSHAARVFEEFKCANMLDYCELYCKLDTLLLAECFISFREEVQTEFELDCWYVHLLPVFNLICCLPRLYTPLQPLHQSASVSI
jgi:hypothetical protein